MRLGSYKTAKWLVILLISQHSRPCTALTKTSTSPLSRSNNIPEKTRFYSIFNVQPLGARPLPQRRFSSDEDDGEDEAYKSRQRSVSTDRPTQTLLGTDGPSLVPPKPKIVVLGATGKVGRLVVRQLLEMTSVDMTIVAFVRDYDKAINVLYDDLVVAKSSQNGNKGPQLEIVQGNLVPPEELPGFTFERSEEEQVWKETALSASKFFGTKVGDYDNREFLPDINEALKDAIEGCTTVISCVGATRPTNVWTDLLARPFWRLLRPDVSRWCTDPTHPYYVHYATTRKVLGYAEREQLRRDVAHAATLESDIDQEKREVAKETADTIPKIRFIRISDLCVGYRPWRLVPLVTNAFQSVVFRYYEMAENLLAHCGALETIVLRPGDLIDEERDLNTTTLQVSPSGCVPAPAVVGREDVAALAVAAAMFQTAGDDSSSPASSNCDGSGFHYTLACRWVGQELNPFPAQGLRMDGLPTAESALKRALTVIAKNDKRKAGKVAAQSQGTTTSASRGSPEMELNSSSSDLVLRMKSGQSILGRARKPRRCQPHGLCAAIPIYLLLAIFAKSLLQPIVSIIPGGNTWLIPALVRIQHKIWAMMSGVVMKLISSLPWLTRPKQYISF